MLLNNPNLIVFFVVILFWFDCGIFVSSVGQNIKDKVHILDEDVLEPEYRETDRLLSVRNYALEDFFWTGSGDGPPPPDSMGSWAPSSVATTTLLATVFIESPHGNGRVPSSSEEDCVSECPISPYDGSPINPTRPGHDRTPTPPPDQRYWLLTVLQAPAVPLPPNLDIRLAKLYRTAFLRQQEEHLGIITTETSRFKTKHNIIKSTKNEPKVSGVNGTQEYSKTTTSKPTSSLTVENYTSGDVEDFRFLNDAPNPQLNSTIDYDTEAPFEYITNHFHVPTPSGVPRRLVKRAVIKDHEDDVNATSEFVAPNGTVDVVKRQILNENQPNVEVFLYNVTREGEGKEELKVIYWVSVGGHPVPALTAARDMKLLADDEVVAELGYPITTKAEPYLKFPEPLNGVTRATNIQDTWLIVGATVLAIILLLVMVAFLVCRLAYKRKSSGSSKVLRTRASIDSKGVQYPSEGRENMGYMQEDGKLVTVVSPGKQKASLPIREHRSSPTRRYVRGPQYKVNRVGSADSSSSTSSTSDLSQMNATLRQRQKLFEQQMHNEYAVINKKTKSKHRKIRSKKVGIAYTPRAGSPVEIKGDGTLQRFLVSDPPSPVASSSDASIYGENVPIRRPTGPVSPTSYLSMPSVKSFPRSNVVEPLSKVLEPLSVRHLDMDSPVHQYGSIKQHPKGQHDTQKLEDANTRRNERQQSDVQRSVTPKHSPHLIRLGSMDKDPGVIGPMVWDLHNQRLKGSKANYMPDESSGANISRMRQRFTELVDDAFSLFGSGYNTPKSGNGDAKPATKVSTVEKSMEEPFSKSQMTIINEPVRVHGGLEQRPLTALPPRPPLPRQGTAWGTTSAAPMSRSSSAGGPQRRPATETVRVNSEGVLSATDPALPLLQAIRSELNKLPGTSDA